MLPSTKVKCPLCGAEGYQYDLNTGYNIVMCRNDDGGCNKYFAVFVSVEVRCDIFKLVAGDSPANQLLDQNAGANEPV